MNILEGVKPSSSKTCNSAKFIIKSKPSAKEPRPEPDPETAYSTNQDVHQLLTYMANKSRRLGELLEAKGIQDSADFFTSSLYDNPCIRTLLKAIMDRLLAERRLGKNLKGINRGILTEIENLIWQSLEREVALYQLNKLYQKEKSGLEQELQARRREIQGQIQALQAEGGRKCLSETNLIIEDSF